MSGASDLWGEWQKHNAQGVRGAQALHAEIDRIARAGGITSPVTTTRGLKARLRYLDSPAGRTELAAQGITRRLLRSWERGTTPSAAKREAVDTAYRNRRRRNIVRSGALKRILDNNGHGRRMEIFPVDQSTVPEKHRRPLSDRSIQARYIWDDAIRAWAADDLDTLDDIWDDVISELDSDFAAYAYVSAIGIGA
ncbi:MULTISPECIES: hypothetical protein [Streptomyces]|uniref:Transcriptional regulator n=1 Tax=Streptomyces tsukubensis (strain DSM 42081 / NBRC 108919 / NRRL 18488 / 9993) TaxID=1114943 RepID=I2NC11_STRT9|nr:hypothetical protein [Streptomyces tsukubensis]MYS67125.1 hypothetical protein [Streptomyces sp. SID5473]AZK92459.1 hypothetical protein B7R87_00020 [Streptomyces tsukubensis]EIF94558.1 hypothetical protein [Streptomyces tsukubensis NRRL18488]QKM65838.1 hypothetical protein STSU_000350 [Streptomyces tsukubensis NRRL18488]TAI40870.1 hypothetical protein EWI31_29775 [Streptomyces tsukubensis]